MGVGKRSSNPSSQNRTEKRVFAGSGDEEDTGHAITIGIIHSPF